MLRKIRVAILEDHQSIVDGYLYRLGNNPQIEVAATIAYGDDLQPTLAAKPGINVLILDVSVPTSPANPNPYPVLHLIPNLLQKFSMLSILAISMFAERGLIRSLVKAGVSGYILKDDQAVLRNLAAVVLSVADGGIYFSQRAHAALLSTDALRPSERLSGRQLEALSLCAAFPNETTAELAQKMAVSNSTVRNLLSSAYLKLGVRTRAAAVDKARQLGLITPHRTTPS